MGCAARETPHLTDKQVTTVTGSGPRVSVFLRNEQEMDEKEMQEFMTWQWI